MSAGWFPATPGPRRLLALVALLVALRMAVYALLAGNLCQWDCGWYMSIVQAGYDMVPVSAPGVTYGEANWVFFPAFALLVRLVAALARMPAAIAGLVVANLAFAVFLLLSARYLARLRPGLNQSALVLFLVVFPYGFYFSVPYTESLYAALTMAVLCLRARPLGAAAAASVLAATRVSGFLMFPVLVWDNLAPVVARWRAGGRRAAWAGLAEAMLPLSLMPLGLVAFIFYLHAHMGDGLAFIHCHWGVQTGFGNPLAALWHGLRTPDILGVLAQKFQSQCFSALCALAGLALALRLLWQRQFAAAWLLGATVLLACCAGAISMQRYVLANPVFLVFLFEWLWVGRGRRFLPGLMLACLVLQLWLVHIWGLAYVALV